MKFHRTLGCRTSKKFWYVPHTECLQEGWVTSRTSRPFDHENMSLENGSWSWTLVKRSWENSLRLTAGSERGATRTHTRRDIGTGPAREGWPRSWLVCYLCQLIHFLDNLHENPLKSHGRTLKRAEPGRRNRGERKLHRSQLGRQEPGGSPRREGGGTAREAILRPSLNFRRTKSRS